MHNLCKLFYKQSARRADPETHLKKKRREEKRREVQHTQFSNKIQE